MNAIRNPKGSALTAEEIEQIESRRPHDSIFLGTGELNGFYTLRRVFWHPQYDALGVFTHYECHDSYIQNLSTDPEEAERKASEYAKRHGVENFAYADFELDEWSKWRAVNETMIQAKMREQIIDFGKSHAGRSYSDVLSTNPDYMRWMRDSGVEHDTEEEIKGTRFSRYKAGTVAIKRLAEIGDLVIPDRALESESDTKDPSEHFGTIGERVEFDAVILFRKWIDNPFGGSCLVIMETNGRDILKTFTTSDGMVYCDKGDHVRIKGTIDAHSVYEDKKETMVKRPKLVWNFDNEDANEAGNCKEPKGK